MNLDGFNLNLLVAFDALVSAPTMTEAAQRLALTQPALSGALRQLREHYDDPLIVYDSAGRQLTPLAQQLAPAIRHMLATARDTRKLRTDFDPATTTAKIEIRTADWIELSVLKQALGPITASAPGVDFAVRSRRPRPSVEEFNDGADLVLTSRRLASSDYPAEMLFEDRFACIAWRDNSRIGDVLDAAAFTALDHVGLSEKPGGLTSADRTFAQMSVRQRVAIRTDAHASLPHLVVGTDLLAVTSWRFAVQSAAVLPLRVLPLPFPVEPIIVVMQWQPFRGSDPMISWIREQLRISATRLPPIGMVHV